MTGNHFYQKSHFFTINITKQKSLLPTEQQDVGNHKSYTYVACAMKIRLC